MAARQKCGKPIPGSDKKCTLRPSHDGECMWINPAEEKAGNTGLVRAMLSSPHYPRFPRKESC